jgi:hypothetical protein
VSGDSIVERMGQLFVKMGGCKYWRARGDSGTVYSSDCVVRIGLVMW